MARGGRLSFKTMKRKEKATILVAFTFGAMLHIWLLYAGCSRLMRALDFSSSDEILTFTTSSPATIHRSQQSISADTDRHQYESDSFPLCDILYRSHVLMGAHHKTGTMLFLYSFARKGLSDVLRSKCVDNDEYPFNKIDTNYHLTSQSIDRFLVRSIRRIQKHDREAKEENHSIFENSKYHIVILNIVRNPLDTVLSAYNYHLKGPELWTRTVIGDMKWITPKYDNGPSLRCSQRILSEMMNRNNIPMNRGYTVQTLYSEILNLNQGIAFEYERYSECCFDEIVSSYDRIKELKNQWNEENVLLHLDNFRTEDFAMDFNGTCLRLMDKIGIIQQEDRMEFLNIFQRFDMGREEVKHGRKRQHITSGTFNKSEQIVILLSDPGRCAQLKGYTTRLEYEWLYADFC